MPFETPTQHPFCIVHLLLPHFGNVEVSARCPRQRLRDFSLLYLARHSTFHDNVGVFFDVPLNFESAFRISIPLSDVVPKFLLNHVFGSGFHGNIYMSRDKLTSATAVCEDGHCSYIGVPGGVCWYNARFSKYERISRAPA